MCLQIWDSSVVLQVSLITSCVLIAVQFPKERSWGLQIQLKNMSDITDSSHIPVYSKSVLIIHFLNCLRLSSSAGFSGCRAMRRTMQLWSPPTSPAVTSAVRLEEKGYPIPASPSQSSDRARVISAEYVVGRDPALCCIQQRWGQENQCDSLLGYPPSVSFLPHVNWLFCHHTPQAWLRQKHLLYHVSSDHPRLQSVVGCVECSCCKQSFAQVQSETPLALTPCVNYNTQTQLFSRGFDASFTTLFRLMYYAKTRWGKAASDLVRECL